uniref:Nitric oxide reductase FlRd-NAD(+) reductase n=1 Tax=Talaromyces marneffei PM1 TaxID=1077442 RepID=A0A093UV40_TALMA
MSSNTNTILVLGRSYAGVGAAHYILKHVVSALPNKDDYRVALVSSSSHFFCRPTSVRVLVSENAFPQDKRLFVPLTEEFGQYTNPFVTLYYGTVVKLDHLTRTVKVIPAETGKAEIELGYYALVIATGVTTQSPLMGLSGGHQNTIDAWTAFREKLSTAKSIFLNGSSGGKSKVAITLITKSKLLPYLPLSLSQKAAGQLSKLGVSVIINRVVEKVVSVDTDAVNVAGKSLERLTDTVTVHLNDNQTFQAELYIPTTGVSPNTNFLNHELLDDEGYIVTNLSSLQVEGAGSRVYAIGYVCNSNPHAIHAITKQVPVVGENLKQDLSIAENQIEPKVTQMVVIGKKGVGMFLGWMVPSFFVWLIKGMYYWLDMTPPMRNGKGYAKPI